jgi:ubiquinone/menaquinone biosynthesis C-methylase UbiE
MDKNYVCPWRCGSALATPLRKCINNPHKILKPYLSDGMTAMDIGSGLGFFTIPMSHMAGSQGKVIAVDLQPEMLTGLGKKAISAGCKNITTHLCAFDSLKIGQWNGTVDFALIFWMLHEVPDAERLIKEIHSALSPDGKLLFAEPVVHVGRDKFIQSLNMITRHGFTLIDRPRAGLSRAAVLQKRSD